ncbi:MAG: hypothetical protein WD271_00975 [Acidimicrobiia bacterium]
MPRHATRRCPRLGRRGRTGDKMSGGLCERCVLGFDLHCNLGVVEWHTTEVRSSERGI